MVEEEPWKKGISLEGKRKRIWCVDQSFYDNLGMSGVWTDEQGLLELRHFGPWRNEIPEISWDIGKFSSPEK